MLQKINKRQAIVADPKKVQEEKANGKKKKIEKKIQF